MKAYGVYIDTQVKRRYKQQKAALRALKYDRDAARADLQLQTNDRRADAITTAQLEILRQELETEKERTTTVRQTEHDAAMKVADKVADARIAADAEVRRLAQDAKSRRSRSSPLISIIDRDTVLARVFPEEMAARCGVQGCYMFVNALKNKIACDEPYTPGQTNKLLVVCNAHAKEAAWCVDVLLDGNVIDTWVHRNGLVTVAKCGICGTCAVRPWDAQNCHCHSVAAGGTNDLSNRVVGSVKCNGQQGMQSLQAFRARLMAGELTLESKYPADRVGKVLQTIRTCNKDKTQTDCVTRVRGLFTCTQTKLAF
jgi:hypothetical protein